MIFLSQDFFKSISASVIYIISPVPSKPLVCVICVWAICYLYTTSQIPHLGHIIFTLQREQL